MRSLFPVVAAALLAACTPKTQAPSDAGVPSASTASPRAPSASDAGPTRGKLASREGSVIARSPDDDALYIADEDRNVVRRVALPLDPTQPAKQIEIPVAGHPAQVLALSDLVLVTVRDPGFLLLMKPDAEKGLVETARVKLAGDAWGIAVTPDGATALVSSAWTHKVSAVDLAAGTLKWMLEVPREPRAVVVRPDGQSAYVSHLVGSSITRLEFGTAPRVVTIDLPAAPARTPVGKTLDASLGYSAVLSDDASRLFVARHAIGALGTQVWEETWFGASTVDVLVTATDTPLAPRRSLGLPRMRRQELDGRGSHFDFAVSGADFTPVSQPRAMVYRASTKTILVAGEGDDRLSEMDALSIAPALTELHRYPLGRDFDRTIHVAGAGGAPSGIVLSADDKTAYVFCRTTGDLAIVSLLAVADPEPVRAATESVGAIVHLADDAGPKDIAMGRKLFFNATDKIVSGGLACNACHPEGRDDAHVWHQATFGDHLVFLGEPEDTPAGIEHDVKGLPRQTPMLAGRVNADGPYGWNGQNKDLIERLKEGFALHRWSGDNTAHAEGDVVGRIGFILAFARKGLVTPPREERALTPEEEKGKAIFNTEQAHCSRCHDPNQGEYTDRTVYPMGHLAPPHGFEDEAKYEFKTPSLRFVGGTPPYFHDGRSSTLEILIDTNNDRMGKTNHLSKEEKASLIAFLRTL